MKKCFLFLAVLLLYGGVLMAQKNPLWLRYPAISPDGSKIAFCYKGDIYTIDVSGGKATQLTTNPAYDYKPVWSPDGSRIAFASDRTGNFDIFVMPAGGGEPERLTYYSGADIPAFFSPDGKDVYFTTSIQYDADYAQFPQSSMSQLYKIPVQGGRTEMVLTTSVNDPVINRAEDKIIYHDYKGYEDNWRKHHTSSVTRDVWMYDMKSGKCIQLSKFAGENRNPVYSPDENSMYFLSERSGDFNVWKMSLDNAGTETQLTKYTKNPVRFLTIAGNGTMCYTWDGEIYTLKEGGTPQKLQVEILTDQVEPAEIAMNMRNGARQIAVSPSGKEIAFVVRGDVFVSSVDYQTTKRITNTPTQERSVDFSPDGRSLVYAGERDGVWNIYTTSLVRPEDKQFTYAKELKEEQITKSKDKPCFEPTWSPDGKSIAYLENRTELKVIDPKTGKSHTVLDGKYNYSYGDGDQYYQWSPDSKWLVVRYFENGGWKNTDIGLVKADGSEGPLNLTQSAYADDDPEWVLDGKAIVWTSDKNGYRSHGSWGSNSDIYIMFLDEQAWKDWQRTKEEREFLSDNKKDTLKKDLKINIQNVQDRREQLTWSPSSVGSFYLSKDGKKLYYSASSQDGYDIWVKDLQDESTKIFLKGKGGSMIPDKDGKNLFVSGGGGISKVELASGKVTPISYSADFLLRPAEERAYILEHAWKQSADKLYAPDLNGVDWAYYKKAYEKFLPYVNNNYDFKDVMGEMLGELNVSHSGARYSKSSSGETTGSLGVFYDGTYKGDGLKIKEILRQGPLDLPEGKIKAGMIVEKINGQPVEKDKDWFKLMNGTVGKRTVLTMLDPQTKKSWEETVKPISKGAEGSLLYERWIEQRRALVDKLSGGRIGYVHVKGMDSQSFRRVFSETLGLNRNKEAIIIDSRFNGGGWLHEDLVTLFSGKKYMDISPRGQHVAIEPFNKWSKPSVLLAGEGNYSDAHAFPYSYKTLELGKVIGMPVPGTMTLVWWETQQDPTLVFGIPQMGIKDNNGKYLEGQQLEPDIKVSNDPNSLMEGRDLQIERAVQELLNDLKK